MRASLIVWLCLSTLLRAESKPKNGPEALIFTNVTVVSTRNGGIEPNVTVVIKKGQITGMAKVGFVDEGRNNTIINAHGKFMIPGLWDMHVHSAFISPVWDEKIIYPLYIANGVTGVRDMGGNPEVLASRRTRIDSGELLGPHLIFGGPFLAGGKSDPPDHRGKQSRRGAPCRRHGETSGRRFRENTFERSSRFIFCHCR